jgi:Spy/CpxP family protein refolding chaperone
MKKFNLPGLFLAIVLLTFIGCNQTNEVEQPQAVNFDSPQFIILDNSDILNGIEDGTLNSEIKFNQSLFGYSFLTMSRDFKPGNPLMNGIAWMQKFDFTKQLGLILRRLELDKTQREAVGNLMKGYHESLRPLVREFLTANELIVKDANQLRREIIEKVKNGELTRQEGAEQIKQLNLATRENIKNNPETIRIIDQICQLNSKLLEDIRELLTPEQQTRWDKMTQRLKTPC